MRYLIVFILIGLLSAAHAQVGGGGINGPAPGVPNFFPTQPLGTNNNTAATTAFVQQSLGPFVTGSATQYNISALNTTVNGSVSAGSNTFVMSSSWDVKTGQGVWIPGAGPNSTTTTPTITGVVVTCNTGCVNTFTYKIIARDANGAYSAATAGSNAASSAAVGSLAWNRDSTLRNFNTVSFTVGANAVDVAVYRNDTLIGIVPATDGQFVDFGQFTVTSPDIPSSPPGSSGAAPLITSVSAIDGPALRLSSTATNSGTVAMHDDGAALAVMMSDLCSNKGLRITLPVGVFNTHQQLACNKPVNRSGEGFWLDGSGGTAFENNPATGGSSISYWGRGDIAALYFNNINGSRVSNFRIFGNYIAKWTLQLDGNPASSSTSGILFDHLILYRVNSAAQSGNIAIGNPSCPPSPQISEVYFNYILAFGNDAYAAAHANIIPFCTSNTKNFHWTNSRFTAALDLVDATIIGASGTWSFIDTQVGHISDTLFNGIPLLTVIAMEVESEPGSRLVYANSGSNSCFVQFIGVQWQTPAPTGTNFVGETQNCTASIESSLFGAGLLTGEYKWNASVLTDAYNGPASIYIFNTYFEDSSSLPVYSDATTRSANVGVFPNDGNIIKPVAIYSMGNYGVLVKGTIIQFPPQDMGGGTRFADKVYARQFITNAVNASPASPVEIYGGARFLQIPDPSAPNVVVNSGTGTSTTYKVAFRDATGQRTTNLSSGTTVSGGATPNNTVSYPTTLPAGTWFMDIIDDTGGQHKIIGTVNTTQFLSGSGWSFTDNNATRNNYTVPASNTTGDVYLGGMGVTGVTTVGALPPCSSALKGARYFVSDSDSAFVNASFGLTVVHTTGSNNVPVTCDGTNWKIG